MNEARNNEAIAVIGMAGRFPKARNVSQLWENLRQGVECITHFTEEELEEAGIEFPKGNSNYVKARGVLEEAAMFDAAFFGVNPKEAEIMDPQQRVFLECAWEALEDAGYDPEREARPVGVFAGMSMNTYLLANLSTHPELMDLVGSYQLMLANDKDFLPTRVSYKLNLKGPSLNIQTACSTSLVAVSVACQDLLNFQCDLALAGGVSITFPQKKGYLYQEGSIVSPDGHCRAFDAKAQGTVAGEGVGIVVLKRLSEALAEGDHIYAVIKGFAINNDGAAKVGFSAPSVEGQAEVIALAQALAGVEPESIQYVVTHGTGTPLGDPIEVAGLTKAFRAGTSARNFCALGSIKTNIGHLDAAAGIAGLINAVLALQYKEIPPSLHYETSNPKIDFANGPFFVNARLRPWERGSTPRRAGVSSFGIGGTNAHVVLEEAPVAPAPAKSRPTQMLMLSAKSNSALEKATENLLAYLRGHPETNLPDLAYTLQVGRRSFAHRRMLVCGTIGEASQILEKREPNRMFTREYKGRNTTPVVFMFPGQGSQHPNMARELYESEPVFREQIDTCAEILRPHLGLDLREVLYPTPDRIEAAREQLGQTWLTQPAIFVITYALARLWINWGIEPESMIGHSVGEYVAACLAGVFSLKEALALVATRGRLVQQQPAGGMLAVRLPENGVKEWLSSDISLAAINSPNLCVLSGPREALQQLQVELRNRGIASNYLDTSHAFHSAMMDPVVGPLTDLVKTMSLKAPRIPYVSTVAAQWASATQTTDPAYWGKHLRETVRFAPALEELLKQPERIFLEVGPGQVLSNLSKQHPARRREQMVIASSRHAQSEQKDMAALMTALGQLWLAGAPINWGSFYANERRQRLSLPTYPFERKKLWIEPLRVSRKTPASAKIAEPVLSVEKELGPAGNGVVQGVPAKALAGKDLIHSMLQTLFAGLSGLDASQLQGTRTFLEMGFDSLFLTQASQAIEKIFGVPIPFGQLLEKYSNLELLSAHLASLVPTTPEAVRILKSRLSTLSTGAQPPGEVPNGPPSSASEPLLVPLTEGQKEIWFASQISDEDSCVFNLSWCVQLKGPLNIPALQHAINGLVSRHESLRTNFPSENLVQQMLPQLVLEIPLADRGDSAPELEQVLQGILVREQHTAFDLAKGPLLRTQIIRFAPEHHALITTVHHLVCDGGSFSTLQNELGELYSAEVENRQPNLAPAPLYSQYTREQKLEQESSKRREDEAFWLAQFAVIPPKLEFPVDKPRTSQNTVFPAEIMHTRVDPNLYHELKRLSASQHCTLFITLLAAYYLLLHRLSGQRDLVVGVPVALRSTETQKQLVGSCVNFLPLRLQVDTSVSFAEHLLRVRKTFLEAFEHHQYSFGSLVQKLNLPRDLTRRPLVAASFNLQRRENLPQFSGVALEEVLTPQGFVHFDLTLNLREENDGLLADWVYRKDLFEMGSVHAWMAALKNLVAAVCANPDRTLAEYRTAFFATEKLVQPPDNSSSGEDNRDRLPPLTRGNTPPPEALLTRTEQQLIEMWKEVIGLKEIGPTDNFFDLGGHSVLVIQVLTRIRKRFGVNLTLRKFFDLPTVKELAAEVDSRLAEKRIGTSQEKPPALKELVMIR